MGEGGGSSRGGIARRALLLGAGGVLATGVVGAASLAYWNPYREPEPLPPGALEIGGSAATAVAVGGLEVDLSSGLTVTVAGRRVWHAHGAFLAVGIGALEWRDVTGHFTPQRTLTSVLAGQTLTSAEAVAGGVRLAGTLASVGRRLAFEMTLRLAGGRLVIGVDVPGADLVVLRGRLDDDEGVHGLGAQFAPFDLRGRHVTLVTREQGVGRGREPLTTLAELTNGAGGSATTTYAPVPSLVTDRFRGVDLDHDVVSEVDLRDGRLDLGVWSRTLRVRVRVGDRPTTLLAQRTDRMAAPPEWALRGGILGVQGGTDAVRRKIAGFLDRGDAAPLSGVWIQDWVGRRVTDFGSRLWWTWELDEDHYPDWDRLTADLDGRGVRVLTYVNPFLVDPTSKPGGVRRDLFAEAADLGHLVRAPGGGPYLLSQGGFDAALVDLTSPPARTWLADVLVDQVAPRAPGGWMADFGEGLPFDAVLADGDPRELHNRWPTLWADLNRLVRDRVGGDRLVFHRSAGRGTSRSAGAFWAGDQLVTFDRHDGMASALLGMLAGGVSGLTVTHSDVGGYTGLAQPVVGVRRSAAVLRRWAEWSAWTPLFRTHEGNRPDESVQAWDAEVADDVAEALRVFAALADHRARLAREASDGGVPMMRHCWVHHPGTAAARRDDQYLFGESWLVAPVFAESGRDRVVTLPPGRWVHLWTGEVHDGHADVRPGHDRMPVFHDANDPDAAALAARVRAVVR